MEVSACVQVGRFGVAAAVGYQCGSGTWHVSKHVALNGKAGLLQQRAGCDGRTTDGQQMCRVSFDKHCACTLLHSRDSYRANFHSCPSNTAACDVKRCHTDFVTMIHAVQVGKTPHRIRMHVWHSMYCCSYRVLQNGPRKI